MAATSFLVPWRSFEPPHPDYGRDAAAKGSLRALALEWVRSAKDSELARGLDRFGKPLAPIKPYTRLHRKSWVGFASPSAPPLTPAYGLSRTRALLVVTATRTGVRVSWGDDGLAGPAWGQILAWHAAGLTAGGTVRDVIGLSPASLRDIQSRSNDWWRQWRRGGKVLVGVGKLRLDIPTAKPRPQVAPTGRTDYERYTFGIGASKAEVVTATAEGRFTGFRRIEDVMRGGGGFGGMKPPKGGAPPRIAASPRADLLTKKPPVSPAVARMVEAAKPKPPRPPKPAPAPKPVAIVKPAPVLAVQPTAQNTALPTYASHRREIDKDVTKAVNALAKTHGLSPAEYKRQATEALKEIVGNADAYVRVADSETLRSILKDGRFKSQFETGTSGGTFAPEKRRQIEAKIIGLSPAVPDDQRPIYGYLSGRNFASTGEAETARHILPMYGRVVVRLKPAIKQGATFTRGDSLTREDEVQATPIEAPTLASGLMSLSANNERYDPLAIKAKLGTGDAAIDIMTVSTSYVEAQYLGGVKVSDIAEVAFNAEPDAATRALLAAAGIPYRVTKTK